MDIEKATDLPSKRVVAALLISVAATLALPHIPVARYAVWPLTLLSTFAHELGHGIAAMLVGGHFDRLEIFSNGSGVAYSAYGSGRFARAFVSAGGLVGPAIASMGLFALARNERRARFALGGVTVLVAIALLFVVRNFFGAAYVLALVIVLSLIVKLGNPFAARLTLVFVAVQLAVSVFTRADYLFTPVARTGAGEMPSDVANMASALFLPYQFWGALCGAVSVVALVLGLAMYLRPPRQKKSPPKRLPGRVAGGPRLG